MQSTFKYSFSIWLMAVILEALMYGFMMMSLGLTVFILSFALLGGLPGLMVFHFLLKLGQRWFLRDKTEKLLFALCSAVISASTTTFIFLWVMDWPDFSDEFPTWLIFALANLSAVISTLIFNQKITNNVFQCTHSEKKH